MSLKRIILYFVILTVVFFGFGLLARSAHAKEITLGWDAVTDEGLSHYNVYQAEVNFNLADEMRSGVGTEWKKIAEVEKDQTEYTAKERDNSILYTYQVTAVNEQGNESFVSNMVCEVYEPKIPLCPMNLIIIKIE